MKSIILSVLVIRKLIFKLLLVTVLYLFIQNTGCFVFVGLVHFAGTLAANKTDVG